MAVTYDAPPDGYYGGPDFETPLGYVWTRWIYPQRDVGNFTMITFGRSYVQQLAYWNADTLDTEDLWQSGFYLFNETKLELQDPGGIVNWVKWFGTVPATYNTYSFEAVTFPGYFSEWNADDPVEPDTSVYRPPITKVVRVREAHSFLLSTTPWDTWSIVPGMKIQTPEMAYVDYVDYGTTANAGAYSDGADGALTYADWIAKVDDTATESEFSVKDPTIQRAYGAGNIWERIEYYAFAE